MPRTTSTPRTKGSPAAIPATDRQRATGPDAIALLSADHATVDGLFKQYEKLLAQKDDADPARKHQLATRICAELIVHTQIEEEIFYPALRQAFEDDDLLDEAEVEHGSIKTLIDELQEMDVGDDLFDAKVTVLGEYVQHHVEEENNEMFPEAEASDVDLKALGEELKIRQEELKAELALDDEAESDANGDDDPDEDDEEDDEDEDEDDEEEEDDEEDEDFDEDHDDDEDTKNVDERRRRHVA